jgi:hypothetical protein
MNYHAMEYCELKQEAKERRIKLYYVMRKAQLIQILSMNPLPEKYIVEKKRIQELRDEARARGFLSVYRLNRSELVDLLYPYLSRNTSAEYQDKDQYDTNKHNTPKNHNTK